MKIGQKFTVALPSKIVPKLRICIVCSKWFLDRQAYLLSSLLLLFWSSNSLSFK